jgi:hypothetical protein
MEFRIPILSDTGYSGKITNHLAVKQVPVQCGNTGHTSSAMLR